MSDSYNGGERFKRVDPYRILVTGGLGYIGSHLCVGLINSGYEVFVYDNLSNSDISTADAIGEITGKVPTVTIGDIRETEKLADTLVEYEIDVVIHLAALKSIPESFKNRLEYFDVNINGTISVLKAMKEVPIKKIIYSSTASVYGDGCDEPLKEGYEPKPTNPYSYTKTVGEDALVAVCASERGWMTAVLRYFNPVGSHPSGKLNDNSEGLVPNIVRVAKGELESLTVHGGNYNTYNGTAIRDYIDISDVVDGHLAVLEMVLNTRGHVTYNIGADVGYTVLDVIRTFEWIHGVKIPYTIGDRRPGDVAVSIADIERITTDLEWRPQGCLRSAIRTVWNKKE